VGGDGLDAEDQMNVPTTLAIEAEMELAEVRAGRMILPGWAMKLAGRFDDHHNLKPHRRPA
jgi:hypothetical protein